MKSKREIENDCEEFVEAVHSMSFGPDGKSDPPGWSMRKPDGTPFDWRTMTQGRREFELFKGEERIGSGFLEPNGNLALN